ncbi:MAG TPA: hypothetical protein VGX48_24925 [Pyrinomonadaceae bacterium]|jgi:hypothetical protein|nr:hypothetical protein [Pyrinomonadaceae bacterium]
MRIILPAALVILFGATAARAARPDEKSPLRFTSEIVGRSYCAGGGIHILQLRLRLRYQNTGGRKLIVYRGKNLFYQTKVRGGPPTGARPWQYEVAILNARFNDAQAEAINGARPGAAFVVLPPGGLYETEIIVGVGVTPEGAGRAANTIRPGEHTLQVIASTWYESKKLGEELRGRWRASGLLWTEPVATEPLKFAAAPDGPATVCR